MAKQHDDWLAKLGAAGQKLPAKETKVSVDHKTLAVRKFPDGLGLAGGYDKELKAHHINLQCGPIPLLLSLRAKLSVEGEGKATGLQRGERTFEVAAGVGISGAAAFGPGKHVDHFTVHGFVGATLGAKATIRAVHTEPAGWDVHPLTIVVYGKGTIGALVEWQSGDHHREVRVEAKLDELELLVVECSSWKSGQFGSVQVREGKDVERIRQVLRDPGKLLEEAARRIIESDTAQAIADGTGKVLDGVKRGTGVDVGQALEDGVAMIAGEPTKAEREQQSQAEQALRAEFEAETSRRRIRPGQSLAPFRSEAEWAKLQGELHADVNRVINGEKPAKNWLEMLDRLDGYMHDRRVKQARAVSVAKSAEAKAEQMKKVDAARFSAQKNSNWLSSRLPADRGHVVCKLFEKGWQLQRKGDEFRDKALGAEGDACETAAKSAIGLYQQAFLAFVGGQRALKAAAAEKQPEAA